MADELVTVLYEGPDPIKPIRNPRTNQVHNFLKGKSIEVPEEFAKILIGPDQNSRGFTADQLDMARAYDHHVFRIVAKAAARKGDVDG
jgi:hypothetical protein